MCKSNTDAKFTNKADTDYTVEYMIVTGRVEKNLSGKCKRSKRRA